MSSAGSGAPEAVRLPATTQLLLAPYLPSARSAESSRCKAARRAGAGLAAMLARFVGVTPTRISSSGCWQACATKTRSRRGSRWAGTGSAVGGGRAERGGGGGEGVGAPLGPHALADAGARQLRRPGGVEQPVHVQADGERVGWPPRARPVMGDGGMNGQAAQSGGGRAAGARAEKGAGQIHGGAGKGAASRGGTRCRR